MQEPALPADEAHRLEDLSRLAVLDTAAEDRFDRITRTACRAFGVPVALVSLVDANRQWFKSRQGLDTAETPRRISFCAHAILREGPFVVTDALADERFRANPMVTGEPHIRAYAGMPLHGPTGQRIGTLCLIDRRPRTFDAADLRALADLAAWAELELNMFSIEHATGIARDREEKLQAVLDTAGDAIVTLSATGTVQTFNVAAWDMFGGGTDSVDRSVLEWLAPESRAAIAAAFTGPDAAAASARGGLRREVVCRRADGSTFPAEIVVTRLRGQSGGGYTLVVRDVAERKRVERMKNEFIATVSHELRTPLTSVRGSLGLLLGGAAGVLPDAARTLLDIATSNCDRLVRLINDMLDIEKIESGHVRFERAPHAVLPLARQAIASVEPFAQGFGVRLQLAPDTQEARVLADADRLTQVMVNLLSNAAKFSPPGALVEIGVRFTGPDQRRVRFTVADRGPGIPQALRGRLFERFAQGDATDARSKPGTGLGLAISKAITERLGGSIGCTAREGGGTEFHIELPALDAPRATAPSLVLVCEDDPTTAEVVCLWLAEAGLGADVAHSAAEARARLAANDYRAMTLDVGLPDEDGLSLLRWLRSQPRTAALPVVVLSADAAPDGQGAAAFGAADWQVKPVDPARLLAAVRNVLRGRPPGTRPLVLHVEDDDDLRQVLAAGLAADCDTVPAGTLRDARRLLAERSFDLVLLDMQLPDGDASALLAGLPARNAGAPVVILSGTEVSGEVAAQVRGALVKSRTPPEQLLALLRLYANSGAQPAHPPGP